MSEPVPHLSCSCGSTAFRVPLEHHHPAYVIECAKCAKIVELPDQMLASFDCPLLNHRRFGDE